MLKNHVKAIEYFEQHLEIATKLNDKTGMLRAWYNLRNGAHSTGDMARTVEYHKLIQKNQGSAPTPFNPKPSGASAAARSGTSESSADDATAGASGATAPPPEKGGKKGKKAAKQAKEKKAAKPKDNEVQAFSVCSDLPAVQARARGGVGRWSSEVPAPNDVSWCFAFSRADQRQRIGRRGRSALPQWGRTGDRAQEVGSRIVSC